MRLLNLWLDYSITLNCVFKTQLDRQLFSIRMYT